MKRGDTLSTIAARCNLSEAAILRANPAIEGSADLQAGQQLRLRADGETLDRLGESVAGAAEKTGNVLSGIAQGINTQVQEALNDNPDVKRHLESFGNRIGLSDREPPKTVSVVPLSDASQSAVTVSASGLPSSRAVAIGAGTPGSAFEIIKRVETTGDGEVRADVELPDWLRTQDKAVFVITDTDGSVIGRSQPVSVAP
ncbi:LysM peptidoglycan-binding domain-containing protein [Mangrovicella endophytica]|uniref:LysM peptidoglycan-binding domain-containing protein n=1 Tax=Mangrovicella endophytica TaxID=2066697 RepID=UPI0012FFE5F1|nr:LysM domain-containing protein [Mangrovicella endophytica]